MICTFDNPDTMRRECWQDGQLIRAYSAAMLCQKSAIPPGALFFGANVGSWETGRLLGDKKAMEQSR